MTLESNYEGSKKLIETFSIHIFDTPGLTRESKPGKVEWEGKQIRDTLGHFRGIKMKSHGGPKKLGA